MIKLFITHFLKNKLVDDVKDDFKAEAVNFLKANKRGIIIHLAMTFTIGFSMLMSLYELIIFGSHYFASQALDYSHLISSAALALISILLIIKVTYYANYAKLTVKKKVEQIKQRQLSPFNVFSPIIDALKEERIRYEVSKHHEHQSQITQ